MILRTHLSQEWDSNKIVPLILMMGQNGMMQIALFTSFISRYSAIFILGIMTQSFLIIRTLIPDDEISSPRRPNFISKSS